MFGGEDSEMSAEEMMAWIEKLEAEEAAAGLKAPREGYYPGEQVVPDEEQLKDDVETEKATKHDEL
jgi:hypothetical protein